MLVSFVEGMFFRSFGFGFGERFSTPATKSLYDRSPLYKSAVFDVTVFAAAGDDGNTFIDDVTRPGLLLFLVTTHAEGLSPLSETKDFECAFTTVADAAETVLTIFFTCGAAVFTIEGFDETAPTIRVTCGAVDATTIEGFSETVPTIFFDCGAADVVTIEGFEETVPTIRVTCGTVDAATIEGFAPAFRSTGGADDVITIEGFARSPAVATLMSCEVELVAGAIVLPLLLSDIELAWESNGSTVLDLLICGVDVTGTGAASGVDFDTD